MIHAVDVADVHAHAKRLGGHDEPLLAALEVLHDLRLLLMFLLAVVGSHQVPVLCPHPRLDAHVDAAGKGIIKQRLVPIEVILHTGGDDALLGLIVGLAFLDGHLPDVEADVLALHRAHIEHTRLHLQRADGLEHHVVVAVGIPHRRGCKGEDGKGMAQRLLQSLQVASQKPVVYAKLLAPRGHRMRLVHHHEADASVAREVADVVGQEQFGREIEQINLAFAHPAVHLRLLFGREVGRSIAHAVVAHFLQALHLVYDEGLQRGDHQGQQAVHTPQINGGQLEKQGLARTRGSCQQNVVHVRGTVQGFFRLAQDVFYQLPLREADGVFPLGKVIVYFQVAKILVAVYFF